MTLVEGLEGSLSQNLMTATANTLVRFLKYSLNSSLVMVKKF
jgi:hypothetical protein